MQPHHYAAFLERMGHTVRESSGVHWFDVFSRAWISFPLETQLNPATVDLSQIMDHRGVMARFCCNVEDGVLSFRQVVADKNYSLSSLDPKARNQTRQGLENCTYGPEDAREIATEGIELHAQTLQRQGRKISDGYEVHWRKYFDAVSRCPSATVWAARYQGILASFLISFRIGSVENICIVRSREELLKFRPNNAMLFTFLQQTLSRAETTEVCIGLQCLIALCGSTRDPPDSIISDCCLGGQQAFLCRRECLFKDRLARAKRGHFVYDRSAYFCRLPEDCKFPAKARPIAGRWSVSCSVA